MRTVISVRLPAHWAPDSFRRTGSRAHEAQTSRVVRVAVRQRSAPMPVLQLDDQQFPLKAGSTRIGAGADADVHVPGYSSIGVEAIIDGGARPTIRRADENAHVKVNSVLLGAEPTPLMHGDKIEVAGLELVFAEDAKGGATQFVSAADVAAIAGLKRSGVARATAASGGRLVSLVDGKEYAIAAGGLSFGREASCDVVVAQSEVSRRHAEIASDGQGYVLRDLSANGVFVNGTRVQGTQLLSRADVLRIGTEEFRFYADVLPAKSTPGMGAPVIPDARPSGAAASAPAPVAAPPAPPIAEPQPVLAASADLPDLELLPVAPPTPPAPPRPATPVAPVAPTAPTAPAAKSVAAADTRPVIAVLEAMNEGPLKGTKHELRTPLAHVGRGAHNDIHLNDESVSETHAKLQRREDGWYVVDMESTNGTYVGGSRITGEKRIDGSPDLRFGGLKFRFSPSAQPDLAGKGTRTIAPVGRLSDLSGQAHSTAKMQAPAAPAPTRAEQEPVVKSGMPGWVWIVVALAVIGAVAFFLLKRPA